MIKASQDVGTKEVRSKSITKNNMLRNHRGDLKITLMRDRALHTKEAIHELDCTRGISLSKA